MAEDAPARDARRQALVGVFLHAFIVYRDVLCYKNGAAWIGKGRIFCADTYRPVWYGLGIQVVQSWRILYYETAHGIIPVYDFIESLDPRVQAKIANTLDLLSQYGTLLGAPHVKKVTGTDLWELRILGGDNVRMFYIAVTGKVFLILHGFIKKKRKTDRKEMKTALDRLKDYHTRRKVENIAEV